MSTERPVSQSTRNFRKLFDITKELFTIPKEINYNSIVQKKSERWNILLDIWQQNSKKYGAVFFYNPLVHILYGIRTLSRSPKVTPLYDAIEDVILNDNEAFNVWVKTKKFYKSYRYAIKNYSLDSEHRSFQQAYGTLRMLNGKNITDVPGKLTKLDTHILNPSYISKCKNIADGFIKMFHNLIPESVGWTYDQWISYNHICQSLYNTYGVDFSSSTTHLKAIKYLFEYRKTFPPFTNIAYIISAPLNYAIIKKIFPKNTDMKLCLLYNEIIDRCVCYEQCMKFQASWLVQILSKWADDPTHPYYESVRKPLIDLLMDRWKCPCNQ